MHSIWRVGRSRQAGCSRDAVFVIPGIRSPFWHHLRHRGLLGWRSGSECGYGRPSAGTQELRRTGRSWKNLVCPQQKGISARLPAPGRAVVVRSGAADWLCQPHSQTTAPRLRTRPHAAQSTPHCPFARYRGMPVAARPNTRRPHTGRNYSGKLCSCHI